MVPRREGSRVFWEILAWTAVVLLYVFRVALIVGIAAITILIVRALVTARRPVKHAGVPARR
jgi:hypothetical protein